MVLHYSGGKIKFYGDGTERIMFGNMTCKGNEYSLDECDSYFWTSCNSGRAVGVDCDPSNSKV